MDISEHMAEHLAQAERHVREAEVRVARQASIVEKLRRQGADTGDAQALLDQMRSVLADFYRNLWRQSQEVAGGIRWVQPRVTLDDLAAADPVDDSLASSDRG